VFRAVRQALFLLVLTLVVGGCLESGVPPAPPADPTALPPPRGNNPNNLVGTAAVAPAPRQGEPAATTAWKAECARQWQSGAYLFSEPPYVAGAPCLSLPTANGTLHFVPVVSQRQYSSTAQAATLPRPDGFFDWVVLAGNGLELVYFENGSLVPKPLATLAVHDAERALVSAVRLADGSSHVVVSDRITALDTASGALSAPTVLLHHVWWQGFDDVQQEELMGGATGIGELNLDANGTYAVTVAGGLESSWLYVSAGGAFQGTLFPFHIFSVDILDNHVVACAGVGSEYVLVEGNVNGELTTPWTVSPIVTSALAHLAFACPVAITRWGVTVVIDTPAIVGGGPNPLAGAVAYSRAAGQTTWTGAEIGTSFWSEEGLFNVGDRLYYWGDNGNGTGSGDENDGTQVRSPTTGDPTGPWAYVWGNFGRTVHALPDEDRILLAGEMWANQPFRYPWFNDDGAEDGVLSWGVLEIPSPS
jgi:hypothetical protein